MENILLNKKKTEVKIIGESFFEISESPFYKLCTSDETRIGTG